MSKLEATAYNYGAKIKGRAMTDISIFEAAYDAAEAECKTLKAENDRLREALEKIAEANWLDDPQEARRTAREALAPGSGDRV